MAKLETLEIPETAITPAGLTQLTAHPSLKHLYLGGIDLPPDRLSELKQAMPNCQITWWAKPQIEYPDSGRRYGN